MVEGEREEKESLFDFFEDRRVPITNSHERFVIPLAFCVFLKRVQIVSF